jgi:hypothetical protein
VSGWGPPPAADPETPGRTHWGQPAGGDPLAPGQLIRRALRLYRSTPRRLLLVAAVPELLRTLLAVPGLAATYAVMEALVGVISDYFERAMADPGAYGAAESQALQAELEATLQSLVVPAADVAAWSAAGVGLGVAVGLIGAAALTAAALRAAAGEPISIAGAYRLVAARAALLVPIVAIGLGWVLVSVLPIALESSPEFHAWTGPPESPRSVLIASLLAVAASVVGVVAVVLAVRWAVFIPVVLVEDVGVGRGLARSARLTHGLRIRLGLAMAGILLVQGLTVGIVAAVSGFVVALAASSVAAGFAVYLAVSVGGSLLWAPLLPALLALVYRDRAATVAA